MNFVRYSLIELKLVGMPWLRWGGGLLFGGGPPDAFFKITEMSNSYKKYLLRILKSRSE